MVVRTHGIGHFVYPIVNVCSHIAAVQYGPVHVPFDFNLHVSQTGTLLSDVKALRGIIDAVPHPVFVKDAESRFVIVNQAFCAMMRRTFDELIGRDDFEFFPKEQADVFRAVDVRVLETGETVENEEYFTDGKGRVRTILTGKSRHVLSDGTPLLIGCITDITDFRDAEAMIRKLADHDYLTGLPNRRAFSGAMAEAIARSTQAVVDHAVLVVDLDGFKPINDVHGHSIGDAVLVEVARRLKVAVRDCDTVSRLGGDEFAIIAQVESQAGGQALARRLLATLHAAIVTPIGPVEVGASIGIALCPAHGVNADALLHAADVAMYRAKEQGRKTFRIYDDSMAASSPTLETA